MGIRESFGLVLKLFQKSIWKDLEVHRMGWLRPGGWKRMVAIKVQQPALAF